MRYPRKDAEHLVGDVIQKMLTETNLARPYLERKAVAVWNGLVGPALMRYISKVEFKGDTLYVHVISPLVRNELMMLREDLLYKMHKEIDERQLKKIVIK